MADDLSWMSGIVDGPQPGAAAAPVPAPTAAPATPTWTPPPGFHPAPDGSGVHTDLSDEDYSKFMKGPPAQANDLKHFAFPPAPQSGNLPQVNLPQITTGGDPNQAAGSGGTGILALPAAGYNPPAPSAAIEVSGASPEPTHAPSLKPGMEWMSGIVDGPGASPGTSTSQTAPPAPQMTGPMRLPAKLIVRSLYLAFRILSGLKTTHLPDHTTPLNRAGFTKISHHHRLAGLLTTELWQRH